MGFEEGLFPESEAYAVMQSACLYFQVSRCGSGASRF